MKTENMVDVCVKRYHDGKDCGTIEVNEEYWELYAAGKHPDFQWPKGIAKADEVLNAEQQEAMGLLPDTTIWLED